MIITKFIYSEDIVLTFSIQDLIKSLQHSMR